MTESGSSMPCCTLGGLDTISMFGMTINNITLSQTFLAITQQIEKREPGYILTPNVDHICEFQVNPEFRDAYRHGFLVLTDGVPIIWASKILGTPIKEKISGSDLVFWLTEYASQMGYSIFFLGAAEGIAHRAAAILQQEFPGFGLAGCYSPSMNFDQNPKELTETIRIVRESAADICYVALGSPKQDLWNYRYHRETGVPVHLGVGASLDFVTGRLRRAPKWMQNAGLEWMWRLSQEPQRLAWRYLVKDTHFFPLLVRELVRKRINRGVS